MTPERWARLTEIFDAAIERPPAERPAFLVAACPEVSLRRDVVDSRFPGLLEAVLVAAEREFTAVPA